ncbi:hypothetical protein GEM_3428 [Burkholderia cepacia GG4]|uniref:Uncharacterized protein n=1 Tax=Burkholderia cepacia GG4 TaxID=1009846 RepID=A0A9W3K495_BURCE|nr:hypothetical protein GEM_3428 [Burkholderia cepacia GG4]
MKLKRIVANVDTQSIDDAKRLDQQIFGLDLLMASFPWLILNVLFSTSRKCRAVRS